MTDTTNPCGWVGHCGILVPHANHMRVEDLADFLAEEDE